MCTDRVTARIVGVLFIVGTVTAIVGGALVDSMTESDAVVDVAGSKGQIVTGALLEMVLALSVAGIAVMIYPVLKRRDEGLALGYVGVRMLEAVLLLTASISALLLLSVSQDHGEDGTRVQPTSDLVLAAREWTVLIGSMVLLGVGGLILYSLLLRAALVPAWLAMWGLAGAALVLVEGVLEMYQLDLPVFVQAVLTAPIALNEMVLAVWLIVRGFGGPLVAEAPARRLTEPAG
jgi:hypothetical protein